MTVPLAEDHPTEKRVEVVETILVDEDERASNQPTKIRLNRRLNRSLSLEAWKHRNSSACYTGGALRC